MAVTNDQLVVDIQVKSDKSLKSTKEFKRETQRLDETINDLSKSISEQTKTQKVYSEAINSTVQTLEKSRSSIERITGSVQAFFVAMQFLKKGLDAIADPATANRLNQILYFLQAIADLKGFDRLATSIEVFRKKANELAKTMHQLNQEFYAGDLDRLTGRLENTANAYFLMQKAVSALSVAMGTFAAMYVTKFVSVLAKYDLEKGLSDGANAIIKSTRDINTKLISFIDTLASSYEKYSRWVSKVGLSNAIKWKLQDAIKQIPSFTEALQSAFRISQKQIAASIYRWNVGLLSSRPELFVTNFADQIVLVTIPTIQKNLRGFAEAIAFGLKAVPKYMDKGFSILSKDASTAFNSASRNMVRSIALMDLKARDAFLNLGQSIANSTKKSFPYKSILDNVAYSFERVSKSLNVFFKKWQKSIGMPNIAEEFLMSAEKNAVVFDTATGELIEMVGDAGKQLEVGFSKWQALVAPAVNRSLLQIGKAIRFGADKLLDGFAFTIVSLNQLMIQFEAEIIILSNTFALIGGILSGDPFQLKLGLSFFLLEYATQFERYNELFAKAAKKYVGYAKGLAKGLVEVASQIPRTMSSIAKALDAELSLSKIKDLRTAMNSLGLALTFPLDYFMRKFPSVTNSIWDQLEKIPAMFRAVVEKTLTNVEAIIVGAKDLMGKLALSFVFPLIQAKDRIPEIMEKIASSFATGFQGISKNIGPVISMMKGNISSAITNIAGAFNETNRSFGDIFGDVMTRATAALKNIKETASSATNIFKEMAKSAPKSTFIMMAEYGATVASALGLLSIELLKSEKGILKFIGVVTLVGSLALGGVSTIITLFISQIGKLAYNIGSVLVDAMQEFTKAANKADAIASQFVFTIKGFNREFGADATGSVEQWSKLIDEAMKNSVYSVNELRKSVKILVAEGTAIHLPFEETSNILKVGMDLASSSGRELNEVVLNIVKSLAGLNTDGLMAMGVNLSETALSHSQFAVQIGKTVEEMSLEEKQQARLFELYKQTKPILGAAISEMQTLEGMQKSISSSTEQLIVKFGRSGFFTTILTKAMMEFVSVLNKIPQPIIDIVSTFTDFLGMLLKLTGIVVTFSLTILGAISTYKVFNIIISASTIVQGALNLSFGILNKTIGANIVAVTSLSGVWINFQRILSAGLTTLLAQLGKYFLVAARAVGIFTLSILSNPLFIKGLAITVVISALIAAVSELSSEFAMASSSADDQESTLNKLSKAWERLKTIISGIFIVLVQAIKLLIIGISGFGLAAKRLKLAIEEAFSKPSPELANAILDVDQKIKALSNGIEKSVVAMSDGFDQAGLSATAYSQTMMEMADKAKLVEMRQSALVKAANGVDSATIKIEVLGEEYEKLTNKIVISQKEVQNLYEEFIQGAEDSKKVLDDYKGAIQTLLRSEYELAKFRKDTLKNISEITKEVNEETIRLSANETEKINQDYNKRKKSVAEFEAQLSRIGPVAGESAKQIIDAYAAIEKGRKAAIKVMKDKKEKEAQEEAIRLLKEQNSALDEVLKKNRELQLQTLSDSMTEHQKINEMLAYDTEQLNKQIFLYKAQWGEQSEVVKALQQQKVLLENVADIQKTIWNMELPDWVEAFGESVDNLFGKENVDGFFNYIKEKMDEVSQLPIVMEVKQKAQEVASNPDVQGVSDAIVKGSKAFFNMNGTIISALSKAGGWIGQAIDVIMNAEKYLRALIDFPKQFLAVIKSIPGLMQQVIDTFPDMIRKIADALPAMALRVVDMLPTFIEAVIDGLPTLVERVAEVVPAIIVKLIGMLPKFYAAMTKGVLLMAQGLVKGLIRGMGNLFTGKMPKLQVDTGAIQEAMKKFSGSNSRLFQVKDLVESVKDPMEAITEQVNAAFKRGYDLLTEAWRWIMDNIIQPLLDGLKAVWTWVMDNIVQPILDGLRAVWTWVMDNIIQPLLNGLTAVWTSVMDNIIKPLLDGLKAVWTWIYGEVITPFLTLLTGIFNAAMEGLKSVFGWINANVITPLSTAIMTAFDWVRIKVIDPLATAGQKIADPIVNAFSGLNNFFTGIARTFSSMFVIDGSGAANAIKNAFSAASSTLTDSFKKAINPFIDVVNWLMWTLNQLKLPELGWSISAGKLGKWSGTLIPAVDLVPGDFKYLQKLATGGLVESGAFQLGGMGTDTALVAGTPGEFMVNRRGVQAGGLDMLSRLNQGLSPSGNTYNMNFEIKIDAKTNIDEGYIRGTLVPRMTEELRRASLDGRFVLSQRGIR